MKDLKNYVDPKDPKDPKEGVNYEPAEEQQIDKDKSIKKPEVERDEDELDLELDDPEFDEYDEDGGDEDFKDAVKTHSLSNTNNSVDGIEGAESHITNVEKEIVNKKG